MKKFKGMKKLNDIIKDAKKIGFEVDTDSFDNGSDYIYLRDVNERMEQIALNTFNGQFYIYTRYRRSKCSICNTLMTNLKMKIGMKKN